MGIKMTAERFIELIEEAEQDPRCYSGRAMYGAQCVGFTVESGEGEELGIVAKIVASAEDNEQAELVDLFGRARTDQMGRSGIIIYFPSMKWPTDENNNPVPDSRRSDEDDEDEDDE